MTLLNILCTMGLPAIDESLAGLLQAMAGANPPGFGPAIAMAKSLGLLLALCVGAYES